MALNKLIYAVLFILLAVTAFAHGGEHAEEKEIKNIDNEIKDNSLLYLKIAAIAVILAVFYALGLKKFPVAFEKQKAIIFFVILVSVVLSSLYLIGGTIYINLISTTGGPVHWHAEFEIYNCGERIDMKNPEGISNRVGSAVFHEHEDNRIHVEGVIVDIKDVSLGNFFKVIGGSLTKESMAVPVEDGFVNLRNGDLCNGKQGKLQVFVYKIVNPDPTKKTGFVYKQEKLGNFEDYVLSPYGNIPPGDCIIIEFDEEKEKTDRICETYKIAMEKGDLSGN